MYHKVVSTDLDSVYYSAWAAGKWFRKQGYGSFIATASMSGHITNIPQLQTPYNAAKAAVIHFCKFPPTKQSAVLMAYIGKGLAVEWAGFARANTISPGYIATEISDFVPQETKDIWKEKIPFQSVPPPLHSFCGRCKADGMQPRGSGERVEGCVPVPCE